jgi:hypothetical protein
VRGNNLTLCVDVVLFAVIHLFRMQESIFTHGPFRNTVTIFGTAISVAVMIIVVYAPFLQVRTAGECVCLFVVLSNAVCAAACTDVAATATAARCTCVCLQSGNRLCSTDTDDSLFVIVAVAVAVAVAGYLWHVVPAWHRVGANDWHADVAAAIHRVHKAPGAHQPRGLVGAQDGMVDD